MPHWVSIVLWSILAAKGQTEGFTEAYAPADSAIARLDAMLPSRDPHGTLLEWLEELRSEEFDFFEGGSEMVQVGGIAITRSAPRGAAWAASLAAAMRPHLFGLGSAPLALAGIMPRALFREFHEEPLPVLLRAGINIAIRCDDMPAHVQFGKRIPVIGKPNVGRLGNAPRP